MTSSGHSAAVQAEPRHKLLDDRFEVGDVIGIGGMGEVRRGFDRRLGREVAVKFLRADLARQADVRARFENEARSAARLSHPAAVTVFDSGESDGVPYLIMECLPGDTLYDRLREGPVPEAEVRQMAIDVLGALGAAHALGIVHRDVKPGNILFTEDGRAKLADFGIAKSTEGSDHTITGHLVGTPAYLAPERLRGNPATPCTDLYSLGVVVYEALVGAKPFQGDTPMALAYAIDHTAPEPVTARLPELEPGFASAVHRALAKDPADRFASASEMAAGLDGGEVSPAADATQVMAFAPSTETLTMVSPAPSPPAALPLALGAWWSDQGPRQPFYLAGLAVAVLLLLLLVGALRGSGGADAPGQSPTTVEPATLDGTPLPLAGAIDELERAVRP